jgi:hypothetical protein
MSTSEILDLTAGFLLASGTIIVAVLRVPHTVVLLH